MIQDPKTLTEVRENAKEKLKGICMVYKDCNGDPTRFCQNQQYGGNIGIGGIGSGASFYNNWLALRKHNLCTKLIDNPVEPDTTFTFFGKKLSMPIMAASVAGVNSFGGESVLSERDFCHHVVQGCNRANTIGWRGDSYTYTLQNPYGLDAIKKGGNGGVKIIKPRAQRDILGFIEKAEEYGCTAVGVDVDGCGSFMMNKNGQPVLKKTIDDLKELKNNTPLPFIVKGIMCVEDARKLADIGVSAVVVSNHGGRVMDHTPGTAEVLPAIVTALSHSQTMVLADGGIRTGYDVFKMLALGAEAVLIGRDVIRAAVGGGDMGVFLQMDYLQNNLAKAMLMTGCATLKDIHQDLLIKNEH